MKLRRP